MDPEDCGGKEVATRVGWKTIHTIIYGPEVIAMHQLVFKTKDLRTDLIGELLDSTNPTDFFGKEAKTLRFVDWSWNLRYINGESWLFVTVEFERAKDLENGWDVLEAMAKSDPDMSFAVKETTSIDVLFVGLKAILGDRYHTLPAKVRDKVDQIDRHVGQDPEMSFK